VDRALKPSRRFPSHSTPGRAMTLAGFENLSSALAAGCVTATIPATPVRRIELRMDWRRPSRSSPATSCQPARDVWRVCGKRVTATKVEVAHSRTGSAGPVQRPRPRFNPTFFSHPKAADGFTLSHSNRVSVSSGSSTACRSPRNRCRDGPRTRHPLRHQRSGFPTVQGHTRRPSCRRERLPAL